MDVKARQDIFTEKGLRIAISGVAGRVIPEARPRSGGHWGKVLVVFDGHTRGYWCPPAKLVFPKNVDLSAVVAQPKERDPYKGVPHIPVYAGGHEFHFGANLKICRRARKMSQMELADKMGKAGAMNVAQSTICYRESHKANPSGWFVSAAAKALSVPPFIFFVDLYRCKAYTESKKFLNGCSSSICT
jgi:hypothetical protein